MLIQFAAHMQYKCKIRLSLDWTWKQKELKSLALPYGVNLMNPLAFSKFESDHTDLLGMCLINLSKNQQTAFKKVELTEFKMAEIKSFENFIILLAIVCYDGGFFLRVFPCRLHWLVNYRNKGLRTPSPCRNYQHQPHHAQIQAQTLRTSIFM